MSSTLASIQRIGEVAETEQYAPFLPALATGQRDPSALARPPIKPLGVDVGNSVIPHSETDGVLLLGDDNVVGIDHMSFERRGHEVVLSPTSTTSVDKSGKIQQEGVVVMSNDTGLLRVIGITIDRIRRPWLYERSGLRWSIGRFVTLLTRWEEPTRFELEVKQILPDTLQQIAQPRHHYY